MKVEVKNGTFSYRTGARPVLDSVSLNLDRGRMTAILGPNGSGKSTLLRVLAKDLELNAGEVEWSLELEPRQIGLMLQDYKITLLPWYSGKRNLELLGLCNKRKDGSGLLTSVQKWLPIELDWNQTVATLSGGQRQVLAFLGSTLGDRKLLLLDEPFAALDVNVRIACLQFLRETVKSQQITTAVVTHDINDAISFFDEILILDGNGKIVAKFESDAARMNTDETRDKIFNIFQEFNVRRLCGD